MVWKEYHDIINGCHSFGRNIRIIKSNIYLYEQMWNGTINLCTYNLVINIKINITKLCQNFEIAAHKPVLKCFLTCHIISCVFHFVQNWYKKIHQNAVLRKHYLNNNSYICDYSWNLSLVQRYYHQIKLNTDLKS